jgi:nucleotide-binding universal stress UspA family protein
MFERILVPLDGSPMAEAVLRHIRMLLLRKDAEVVLVQVVPVLPAFEGGLGGSPQALAALQDQAETYLGAIREKLASQGARVRSLVRVGFPAETIIEIAGKEKASLIVLSTHGRTGLVRWVMGSVAEKVIRASSGPVLVVRSFLRDPAGRSVPSGPEEIRFKKMLVCVDGSDLSLEVVPPAAELAGIFGSQVYLLNVLEDHLAYGPPVPQLNRAYERFREAGVKVEPTLKKGDPASEILDACSELGADLIAMTTHGRGGIKRWALGSVVERVLRSAAVPLLVVRSGRPVR